MWPTSKCALSLFLLICCLISLSECSSAHRSSKVIVEREVSKPKHRMASLHRVRRTYVDENENCATHEFEMVHTIMDRICMLCHELQSHYAPNTRVECRKDCFRNETFQSCMKIFSGSKPVQQVEPTAPVPLYTEDVQTLDDIKERRRRI